MGTIIHEYYFAVDPLMLLFHHNIHAGT